LASGRQLDAILVASQAFENGNGREYVLGVLAARCLSSEGGSGDGGGGKGGSGGGGGGEGAASQPPGKKKSVKGGGDGGGVVVSYAQANRDFKVSKMNRGLRSGGIVW
jgi:hypothetical protein